MVKATLSGDPRLLYVKRDRFDWPAGYFQRLIGLVIPFQDAAGTTLTGRLTNVRETEESIELVLWGIAPEADGGLE